MLLSYLSFFALALQNKLVSKTAFAGAPLEHRRNKLPEH